MEHHFLTRRLSVISTAGGKAPALFFVVSRRTTVLCLTGRYLSTNYFIAASIGGSMLPAGGSITSTSRNSILDYGTGWNDLLCVKYWTPHFVVLFNDSFAIVPKSRAYYKAVKVSFLKWEAA